MLPNDRVGCYFCMGERNLARRDESNSYQTRPRVSQGFPPRWAPASELSEPHRLVRYPP